MTHQPDRKDFDFNARFDLPVCDTAGGRRHLILELRTPPRPEQASRQPLDLVFVIDASSSMAGDKLEAVKQALQQVGAGLRDDDSISLVSFASDVQVHLVAATAQHGHRALFVREVQALSPRGSTNLSGGWLAGVELALSQAGAGRRRALLLLSDGQANLGVLEAEQLSQLATETARRGVATTCVGVGADYSTVQLGAIADASGGRFHHADTPEAIVAVLTGELGELAEVAAEQLELQLVVPQGFGVQVLVGAPTSHSDGVHRVQTGTAYCGMTRTLVVAIDAPARGAGFVQEVRATLVGRDASGAPLSFEAGASLSFGDARGLAAGEAEVLLVAQHMSAWMRQQALNHNESGAYHRVRSLASEHMQRLRLHVGHVASARMVLDGLDMQMKACYSPMEGRALKEKFVLSRKELYQERELRREQGDMS